MNKAQSRICLEIMAIPGIATVAQLVSGSESKPRCRRIEARSDDMPRSLGILRLRS